MGFPSPGADYVEQRISLDELLINHPSSTYFMRAGCSYWKAGIVQGALLVIDSSVPACDGSVVVCRLRGEMGLRRLRLHPRQHLESLGGDGRCDYITDDSGDCDTVFGVVTHTINDMRNMEIDDNPEI